MFSRMTSALAALFLCATAVGAGDWRSEFKTPDGIECCGIHDCRALPRARFIRVGDEIVVFPGRVPTTITVVHPSQDHQVWVCTTGCAFVPGMM